MAPAAAATGEPLVLLRLPPLLAPRALGLKPTVLPGCDASSLSQMAALAEGGEEE